MSFQNSQEPWDASVNLPTPAGKPGALQKPLCPLTETQVTEAGGQKSDLYD